LKTLTSDEIKRFACRKGVKAKAVENFLVSLGDAGSKSGEIANMHDDAHVYGWNAATQKAIRDGIEFAYKSKV
jgi:hypothetical protein